MYEILIPIGIFVGIISYALKLNKHIESGKSWERWRSRVVEKNLEEN